MPLPKRKAKPVAKKVEKKSSKPPKKLVYILQEDEDERPVRKAKKAIPPKLA